VPVDTRLPKDALDMGSHGLIGAAQGRAYLGGGLPIQYLDADQHLGVGQAESFLQPIRAAVSIYFVTQLGDEREWRFLH